MLKKEDMWVRWMVFPLLLISGVESHPGGAGIEACDDLTPRHGSSLPQPIETSPYFVTVDVNRYTRGGTITVTLSGTRSFKGFLLVATNSSSGDVTQTVGTLEGHRPTDSINIQNMCSKNKAVTHNQVLNTDNLLIRWNDGDEPSGNIYFYATFVENVQTFWVKIPSTVVCDGVSVCTTTSTTTTTTPAPIGSLLSHFTQDDCTSSIVCWTCTQESCGDKQHVVIWKKHSDDMYTLEMSASGVDAGSYVALGIAPAASMTDVTIISCIADEAAGVKQFYAASKAPPTAVTDGPVSAENTEFRFESATQKLSCRFTFDITSEVNTPDKWKDLREGNKYYIFLARGSYANGALRKHDSTPLIYSEQVDFMAGKDNSGVSLTLSERRVIGILMMSLSAILFPLLSTSN